MTNPKQNRPSRRSEQYATLNDVCRALGVSTATVSRALNNKPGVSEELRLKVLAKVKELNYVPSAAARNLSRAKTDTLGIVFQDVTGGWLIEVYRGIARRAIELGYNVMTTLSLVPGDELDLPRRLLSTKSVDGLVWFDPRTTPQMIRTVEDEGVPFVLLQPQFEIPNTRTVGIECRSGAYAATQHLLEVGHRNLMLVTGQEDNADSQSKLAGVEDALREANLSIPPERILIGHHVAEHAVNAVAEYLDAGHSLPDAIFAFNDDMGIAILNMLRGRGLRVPTDVALMGFDGIPETRNVQLTTVETPMFEMGCLAAETVIAEINTPTQDHAPKQVLLKGKVVPRLTCGRG